MNWRGGLTAGGRLGHILEILDSLPLDTVKDAWTSDRKWTSELKRRLGLLGTERGYYICFSGYAPPGGQGDWLYDHVGLQIQGQSIVDVPLVLESVW